MPSPLAIVATLAVLAALGALLEGIPGAWMRLDDWWVLRQYLKRERKKAPPPTRR